MPAGMARTIPITTPTTDRRQDLPDNRSQQRRLLRPERHPDADLLGAQRHAVRHHAENPEAGQRQCQHADAAGDRARHARPLHVGDRNPRASRARPESRAGRASRLRAESAAAGPHRVRARATRKTYEKSSSFNGRYSSATLFASTLIECASAATPMMRRPPPAPSFGGLRKASPEHIERAVHLEREPPADDHRSWRRSRPNSRPRSTAESASRRSIRDRRSASACAGRAWRCSWSR